MPGYAVVNLGADVRLKPWVQLLAQITNLFDTRYYTAAQLGSFGFTDTGAFVARPLPPVNGEFRFSRRRFTRLARRSGCGSERGSSSEAHHR